ncbi:integrase core domain-containing protein [Microbacterium aurum]
MDNALIESFWSTMQRELLDRSNWTSKTELSSAMFEWIEGFYNPTRRHTALGNLSPVEFERLHIPAATAA